MALWVLLRNMAYIGNEQEEPRRVSKVSRGLFTAISY
jgi:hypothetical protein